MRVVFMGTPAFAVPTLQRLVDRGHEVLAVLTQPDRPKGRGHTLAFSPVKEAALRVNLPVHQPERVRRPEAVELLRGLAPDVMVVVGYGQIIPQSIIDIPQFGIINVHASLLPKYRGAAPIQWAVANGETITGVTTMKIDAGLDTGGMLLKAETPIGPEETAIEVGERLAVIGADLLIETLDGLAAGTITPIPQDHADATLAPILKKEDGAVDWHWPAAKIHCQARAFLPWPGCHTTFRGVGLQLWKVRVWPEAVKGSPGTLHPTRKQVIAACGDGTALELIEVQLDGRKRVTGAEFVNGQRIYDGDQLGETKP